MTTTIRRLAIAVSMLFSACTMTLQENHFFNPGPARVHRPLAAPGAVVEMVTMNAADGVALTGAAFRPANADVTILYFGGNASMIDEDAGWLAERFTKLRANFVMFDYRGYGRSKGTPTIEALKSDALAELDYVRQHFGGRPILVHGVSLGSFMAAHAAANGRVDGLVLESTAPDVEQWAKSQIPGYAKGVMHLQIAPALLAESNERALRQYDGPLLLMTGANDTVTPPRFAQSLGETARSQNKRVVIIPKAIHGDVMDTPEAATAYRAFLDSIIVP